MCSEYRLESDCTSAHKQVEGRVVMSRSKEEEAQRRIKQHDGQAGMAGDWVSLAVKTALSRERKETATYSVGTTLRTLHMQNANTDRRTKQPPFTDIKTLNNRNTTLV